MRKTMNSNEVPFQVEHLINSLLNQKENVHLRQNYRHRLVTIREVIDKSLKKFDTELYNSNSKKKRA